MKKPKPDNKMVMAPVMVLRTIQNETRLLPFIQTLDDRNIIFNVAAFAMNGCPLTLKNLVLEFPCSQATVERRIARLKKLGMIEARQSQEDRRVYFLEVGKELKPLLKRFFESLPA